MAGLLKYIGSKTSQSSKASIFCPTVATKIDLYQDLVLIVEQLQKNEKDGTKKLWNYQVPKTWPSVSLKRVGDKLLTSMFFWDYWHMWDSDDTMDG